MAGCPLIIAGVQEMQSHSMADSKDLKVQIHV
jgi:hypothetical protein